MVHLLFDLLFLVAGCKLIQIYPLCHKSHIHWTINGFLWKSFLSKSGSVFLSELKSLTIMFSLFSLLRNRLISIPFHCFRFWKYHWTMHVSLRKTKHPDTYCYHFGLRSWNIFFFLSLDNFTGGTSERYPPKDEKMNLNKFDINDVQLWNKFELKGRKFQICTYVHM